MAPFGGLVVYPVFIVFGFIFAGVGLVLVGIGINAGYRSMQIQLSDVQSIGTIQSTADGPIEVEGTVQDVNDLDTITAPLSGKECYAWATLRKKRKVDTDSKREKYKTEVRAKHATPFVLRDDSGGEIEVNPEHASLSLDEVVYSIEYGDEVDDEARQRVRNLSADEIRLSGRQSEEEMEPDDLLSPTNPKYEEYALIPGDEVHVYGAEAQAPTNRSRQAELIGDDFYTITEGDESAAIKKKLLGAVITCLLGLPVLGFSLFVIYGGIMNILEII